MSKFSIKALVVLITSAFVGLIAIQLYWINNSILLREQQFDQDIHSALQAVVDYIDTREKSAAAMEVESSERPSDQPIAEMKDGPVGEAIPPDAASGKKSTGALLDQADLLKDIKEGILAIETYPSIEDRVELPELEALIKDELLDRGVKASFLVGVFNRYKQPEILGENAKSFLSQLKSEGYSEALFPSDLITDNHFVRVYFPTRKQYVVQTMWGMLLISALLILLIMSAFLFTIITIFRQKKLSRIKNDFINNMTHELKTPISTISLACEALSDPDMSANAERTKAFIGMISEENKRLGILVENVLRSAILDRGDMKLVVETINIHEIIQGVVRNIAIQVKKHNGTIRTYLDAPNPVIEGDKVHLTNVLYNLIDNAVKYSPDGPVITITTRNTPSGLMFGVSDEGLGIPKEYQGKIFDKLFRVPTGNIHDVKGFGLGLSYVQAVVLKHHGNIQLQSELKKGSAFNVFIPSKYEEQD